MIKYLSILACLITTAAIQSNDALMQSLHDCHVVQHGSFVFKSGQKSSIYIDMRNTISSPMLLQQIAEYIHAKVAHKSYDCICGVPYGALPLATTLALHRNEPLILLRHATKAHGRQKRIEGIYTQGNRVLLVEDVITTGSSILEAIDALEASGLVVEDVIVFLDRQDGGIQRLKNLGYSVHAVCTLSEILESKTNQNTTQSPHHLTYAQRAQTCTNNIARNLFTLMEHKQTNLAVAADVTTTQDLLNLADMVGPYICVLKLHIDILSDFSPACITQLQAIAQKHNFLLMEDRKFSDIGSTTQQQYTQGIYSIADWADLVTVHAIPGPGILDQMKQGVNTSQRAAILITQMSSQQNLATDDYTQKAYAIGKEHADFVAGFIAQTTSDVDTSSLIMTPGINLQTTGIADQQYNTPHKAICENNTDIIIVGRAIYNSPDPVSAAIAYRDAGWEAYKARL